ncbi:MAG: ABC transporter permease, partial [Cyclobacteriaceae bacterium]
MLKNFLKIAYRNLLKKRVYTFINVLGLSVGAAASLLIFLYVRHEHSYDKFYRDTDQLYRVAMERSYPDRVALFSFIPGGYASAFKEEIPEIEKSTRLVGFPDFASVFRYNDVTFQEKYHFFADSNFFDVLDFKLVKGNPKTALKFANTVIVSESMAKKYFGSEDPIGKTLEIDTAKHEVVGVMQDIPRNSHLKFDFLSSSTAVGFLEEPNYYISSSYTYIKLANGVDPKVVEFKMPAVVEKYAAGQIERELGITFKDYQAAGNGYNYFLQPIGDIHLHSQLTNEIKPNGNITYVNILVFIGFLILLIAGINFVNLATARSTERAKEVGVRKVLGSRKNQLIYQFLSESMVISLLSIVIAIGLIQVTLGVFNSVIPTPVEFNLMDGFSALTVVSITLMMGLVAGLYPAFYISSLKPVAILKGKLHASTKGGLLRKGLIIFQFTIS